MGMGAMELPRVEGDVQGLGPGVRVEEWGNQDPAGTKPRETAPESSGAGRGQAASGKELGGRGAVCGRSHSAEPAGKEGSGERRRRCRCSRGGVLGLEGKGKGGATAAPGGGGLRAHCERGQSCAIDVTSLGFPQRREHG